MYFCFSGGGTQQPHWQSLADTKALDWFFRDVGDRRMEKGELTEVHVGI